MEAKVGKHTESDYLKADPFGGDESDIKCRTVTIKRARKEHTCYGLEGKQDHAIKKGDHYRHERALVDRTFWGEYRLCLDCMDKFLAGDW
jgi:hypothetical protein